MKKVTSLRALVTPLRKTIPRLIPPNRELAGREAPKRMTKVTSPQDLVIPQRKTIPRLIPPNRELASNTKVVLKAILMFKKSLS